MSDSIDEFMARNGLTIPMPPEGEESQPSKVSRRYSYDHHYGVLQHPFGKRNTDKYYGPESLYDPYWKGGDWVYYRKESTSYPRGYYLNTDSTAHDECNQICTKISMKYGAVCGLRLNRKTWKNEFKDFKDMCHLQLENCVSKTKHWYPIRKGPCGNRYMTTVPSVAPAIVSRAKFWEKNFPEHLYNPYAMVINTDDPRTAYKSAIGNKFRFE